MRTKRKSISDKLTLGLISFSFAVVYGYGFYMIFRTQCNPIAPSLLIAGVTTLLPFWIRDITAGRVK
jgi:hypothetical protein